MEVIFCELPKRVSLSPCYHSLINHPVDNPPLIRVHEIFYQRHASVAYEVAIHMNSLSCDSTKN